MKTHLMAKKEMEHEQVSAKVEQTGKNVAPG